MSTPLRIPSLSGIVGALVGILLALLFLYVGLTIASDLGDRIAGFLGKSSDSTAGGIVMLACQAVLLPIGYVLARLMQARVLRMTFLWTVIVLDGLYILWLAFYLSL